MQVMSILADSIGGGLVKGCKYLRFYPVECTTFARLFWQKNWFKSMRNLSFVSKRRCSKSRFFLILRRKCSRRFLIQINI